MMKTHNVERWPSSYFFRSYFSKSKKKIRWSSNIQFIYTFYTLTRLWGSVLAIIAAMLKKWYLWDATHACMVGQWGSGDRNASQMCYWQRWRGRWMSRKSPHVTHKKAILFFNHLSILWLFFLLQPFRSTTAFTYPRCSFLYISFLFASSIARIFLHLLHAPFSFLLFSTTETEGMTTTTHSIWNI